MTERGVERLPINGTAVEIGKIWCVFVFKDDEIDAKNLTSEPLIDRPDLLPEIPESILELMSLCVTNPHDKRAVEKEWHVLTVGDEVLGAARTRTFDEGEQGSFTLIQWRPGLGTKVKDFCHLQFGLEPREKLVETPVLIVGKKGQIKRYQKRQIL